VLLTSRSEESWLPAEDCLRIPLGGLRGEELWDYAAAVIEVLQLTVDRKDKDLQDLLGIGFARGFGFLVRTGH
jgi:hypothetical protein